MFEESSKISIKDYDFFLSFKYGKHSIRLDPWLLNPLQTTTKTR